MDLLAIINAALTIFDWAETRAIAAGETIPQEVLDQRTELRRELARQAADEAS